MILLFFVQSCALIYVPHPLNVTPVRSYFVKLNSTQVLSIKMMHTWLLLSDRTPRSMSMHGEDKLDA